MRNIYKSILCLSLIFCTIFCKAQNTNPEYINAMGNPQANFYSITAQYDSELQAVPLDITTEENEATFFFDGNGFGKAEWAMQ